MTKPEKQRALDAIADEIARCRVCKRGKVGLPVPGEGNPDAEVVFIGEAPGKLEAQTGKPFVGRSGKVLRAMIAEIGLKDTDVFITSPVKYLPKHVTPTPADVAHGRKHLLAQLDIIQPKIIVLMGRVAALALLQEHVSIADVHGTEIDKDGRTYLVAYHPAATLYAPKAKEPFRKDFLVLKQLLKK